MKKFFSLVLALVMALSLTTVAWAEPTEVTDEVGLLAVVATGGEIKLMNDVTISAKFDIATDVTIDLNGKKLSSSVGYAIYLKRAGKLVITDSSAEKTGVFTNEGGAKNYSYGLIDVFGVLEINGGTIKNYTGTAAISSVGTVVVNGGAIINEASSGNAIFTNHDADLTVSGGEIINNASSGNAVFLNGQSGTNHSTATITGGKIVNNATMATAITVNAYSQAAISGGEITNVGDSGTAVYLNSNTSATITGGKIVNDGDDGVAVEAGGSNTGGSKVTVSGGEIINNGEDGTAIEVGSNAEATISAGEVVNNGDDGYAIYANSSWSGAGTVAVTGGEVSATTGTLLEAKAGSGSNASASISVSGGSFSGDVSDYVASGSALVQDTNGNWVAGAAVTFGDKFDLYLANAGMNTALTLKTPTVAGLSFDEVAAKTNKDGSGRVAYIAANNGQFFVKTTNPTVSDYAVTDAGKNTVLYYVTVAGTSAANFEYAEAVSAFTKFSTYDKCDYVTATPVAGETYFMAADGNVYKAAAAGTGTNYLLNGKVVSGVYEGVPETHTFTLNGYKYDATLKQNVPTSALCTKCMMNTGSIYPIAKVPATYTLYPTTGEGSNLYTVALPGAAAVVPGIPSTDVKVESAETFDAGIAMYVGMSVMAAAGSVVVLKKRED